jgi:hypothetical protein
MWHIHIVGYLSIKEIHYQVYKGIDEVHMNIAIYKKSGFKNLYTVWFHLFYILEEATLERK